MLAHLPLVKRNIGRVISSCQFVCIGDTHILNLKHTLVRTEILSIISFYENVKNDVFTQFCFLSSACGFGPGGPYPLADLDRGVQIR